MPLVVAGGPIGNPDDASPRFRDLLATADVLLAEDTRRVRRLASSLGIRVGGRLVSCYDANEAGRARELSGLLAGGATVALVTDAGMPLVSDPGYRVVAAAVAAGADVTVVPGPSALTAAVAVSGLPSDRLVFEGFLPRTAGPRRRRIAELARERRTLVLFEAPHRIRATLADLAAGLGADRQAVLCRELTKTFEEVVRADLGTLAATAATRELRGELSIVVAGSVGRPDVTDDALVSLVRRREEAGEARRPAIASVARETGEPRRRVYEAVVQARLSERR